MPLLIFSIEPRSDELKGLFPVNVFEFGESEGLPKPIVYGSPINVSPLSLGGGLYQFSDGNVTTSDFVWSVPPIVHIENGKDFAPFGGLNFVALPAPDDSGYTTHSASAFDWTQTSTKAIDVTSPFNVTISVEGDGVEIVASDDGDFSIKRTDEADLISYTSGNFDWEQESSTVVKNIKAPEITATLTGDCEFADIGDRVFKITADNGSGDVTLGFNGNVKDLDLVLVAVRDPSQTVSNWSTEPKSITPEIDANPHVHEVAFRGLNSNTLSFDYSSTSNALLTGIWIRNISYYNTEPATVKIESDTAIHELTLGVGLANGSQSISNESFDVTRTPSGALTAGVYTDCVFSAGNAKVVSFSLDIGHGEADFNFRDGCR